MFKLTLMLTDFPVMHNPERIIGRCYFLQDLTLAVYMLV
uniref:Uncharacterized protein n=1 Tax=Arundo donax TaxID=35708 RepID=A0A0A9HGE8_ARUDO